MPTTSPSKASRSRSPKGVSSANRIALNLTPEERQQLEALAAHESRTLSAMSRVLVLAGMKAFDNKPAT